MFEKTLGDIESNVDTLKRHGKTFHWASRLLSSSQMDRAASLYALCRDIDDLADNALTPDEISGARRALSDLALALESDAAPSGSVADLHRRSMHLFECWPLGKAALIDLIQAISGDLEPVAIRSFRELKQYAYGVAGTVGVMMTGLLDAKRQSEAFPHAIDLGIGMQLTNIARDVLEDAYLGRMYLPADGAAGSLQPTDITFGNPLARKRAWAGIQELLIQAEPFYRNGWRGLHFLPTRARLSIAVASRVYREIGVQLIAEGEESYWHRRCVVPAWRKGWVSVRAISDLMLETRCDVNASEASALHRDISVCSSSPGLS